jgi:hypothetical protein
MTPRLIYRAVAAALLAVEGAIARGLIPGALVRNSVGDLLVIPLLYVLVRALANLAPGLTLVVVLAVGLAAELLQYVHLADLLGLRQGSLASIVLGNTFSSSDLLMYGIGGALAAWLDVRLLGRRSASQARHRDHDTA